MHDIRKGTCPKCNGVAIGHLPVLVDWDRGAHKRRLAKGKIGRMSAYGEVEAYVCTECGYFEEFVRDPKSVPWTNMDGFTWVNDS